MALGLGLTRHTAKLFGVISLYDSQNLIGIELAMSSEPYVKSNKISCDNASQYEKRRKLRLQNDPRPKYIVSKAVDNKHAYFYLLMRCQQLSVSPKDIWMLRILDLKSLVHLAG